MKKLSTSHSKISLLILLLTLFFHVFASSSFATEQETDILIFNNDTIYLEEHFLENLHLIENPFGATRQNAPSTGCWRGYRAIWRILDNKLYLDSIIRCEWDDEIGEEDIFQLFKNNRIKFQEMETMIFAEWVNSDLYTMNFGRGEHSKNLYLYNGAFDKKKTKEKNLRLRIMNGIVEVNTL